MTHPIFKQLLRIIQHIFYLQHVKGMIEILPDLLNRKVSASLYETRKPFLMGSWVGENALYSSF